MMFLVLSWVMVVSRSLFIAMDEADQADDKGAHNGSKTLGDKGAKLGTTPDHKSEEDIKEGDKTPVDKTGDKEAKKDGETPGYDSKEKGVKIVSDIETE